MELPYTKMNHPNIYIYMWANGKRMERNGYGVRKGRVAKLARRGREGEPC